MKLLSRIAELGDFFNQDTGVAEPDRSSWHNFCADESIDEIFWNVKPSDLQEIPEFCRVKLQKWFFTRKENLILHGITGSGKSHAALVILKSLRDITPNKWVRYVHSDKIISKGKAEGIKFLEEVYGEPSFLVIDDLGVDKPAEWEQKFFYAIINKRFSSCKPTIVTTNNDISELELIFSKRLTSRLSGDWVKFPDVDFRALRNNFQ